MLSNRQLKIGETIKRLLSQIIFREMYIQSLDGIHITLSKVIMTTDLGIADVYIMPMVGCNLSDDKVLEIINKVSPKIRYFLSKKAFLKKLPQLRFKMDNSLAEAARIEKLLSK